MKISLPLLLVIGLIGYAVSLPTTEIKTTNICSECEFTELTLTTQDTNNVKLVKLQNCLASKKRSIEQSEAEKKQQRLVKRSADEQLDTTTSFNEMFAVSRAFKKMLKQYLTLKQSITKQIGGMKKSIDRAMEEMADSDFQAEPESMTVGKPKVRSCADRIQCTQPNTVIKVQQAVLTSQNNEEVCGSLQNVLPLNLADMDEACYNKEEATKRTKTMCDGQTECEVSISLYYNTLCDCTEKKHLEVEYTCEPETKAAKHSVAKRSMYYQNDQAGQEKYQRFANGILDYYGDLGFAGDYYYDNYDYLCAYDYYSYAYGGYDYCGDYYDYYGDDRGGRRGGVQGQQRRQRGDVGRRGDRPNRNRPQRS